MILISSAYSTSVDEKKTLSYHYNLEHIRLISHTHTFHSTPSLVGFSPGPWVGCGVSSFVEWTQKRNITKHNVPASDRIKFSARSFVFFYGRWFRNKKISLQAENKAKWFWLSFQFFICRRSAVKSEAGGWKENRTSRSYLPKKIVSTIERESQRRNQTSSLERRLMLLLFHPTSSALPLTRHPVLHEKGFSSSQNRNFIRFVVGARKILTNPNDIGQWCCVIQFRTNQKYHNHFSYHFSTVFRTLPVTSTLFRAKITRTVSLFDFFSSYEKRKFFSLLFSSLVARLFTVFVLQF